VNSDSITIVRRSQELRRQAQATIAAPHTAQRMADIIQQHRQLLLMNRELEVYVETSQHDLGMLVMQLHELVETSMRDTTGFDWMKAFPEKSRAMRHFQALHSIARYLKLKSQAG
jgi:hypothetical protein